MKTGIPADRCQCMAVVLRHTLPVYLTVLRTQATPISNQYCHCKSQLCDSHVCGVLGTLVASVPLPLALHI